ncbi:class I SAM-dependent methyltransferase [Streptomyces amakusaensis]|uniref:Class I SAM-dependent methyltransferase n=1 Tax=Streptomyces amakusaensis TaxID=67271 RepID=A0ABW0AIL9_9ACTN
MADRDGRPPGLGSTLEARRAPLHTGAVRLRERDGTHRAPRAAEAADALDEDGAVRFGGARGPIGPTTRTLLFDTWIEDFLGRHPAGTVVEFGTGPSTRFERLDNGTVHWFDLGLPEVTTLGHAFGEDTGRRRAIAASVTDPGWVDAVRASPGPYFLVGESTLIRLAKEQVRDVFRMAAERLPGAHLALETASGRTDGHDGHEGHESHEVLGGPAARPRWRCEDPAEPEGWHDSIALAQSCTFARLPAAVSARLPMAQRGMLRAMATVMRRQIQACRFNLYRLG